jgi:hypothetical protein
MLNAQGSPKKMPQNLWQKIQNILKKSAVLGANMVAKTAKSKKAKGTKLENKVAEHYRRYKIDETARRMPLSGAMTHFKSDIYKRNDYEWVDECKAHETVNLAKFWDQTTIQAPIRTPVLHISANYRPIVTIIRQSDFEYLVKNDERRYDLIDISRKKRFNFWDYASKCIDMKPRATVIYCTVHDDSLAIMTIDTYMQLRTENPIY